MLVSLTHLYFLFHYLLIDPFKCHTLGLNWIFIWLKETPFSCTLFFLCRIDSRDGISLALFGVLFTSRCVFTAPVTACEAEGVLWWTVMEHKQRRVAVSRRTQAPCTPHAINKVRATRPPDAYLCCFFISNPERSGLGFGSANPPRQSDRCPG